MLHNLIAKRAVLDGAIAACEPAPYSVITFSKRFGSGTLYSYAAIRVGDLWYRSGTQGLPAVHWEELISWAFEGPGFSDMAVATDWVSL